MLSRYFNGLNDPADHIVCRSPFHFLFRSQHKPVAQHSRGYIYDIVGKYVVASPHRSQRLGSGENADGSPGRSAQVDGLMIAGCSHDGSNEMDELLLHVQAAHLRAQLTDAGSGEYRLDLIQAVACRHFVMVSYDLVFLCGVGVAYVDLEQEAVELGFRQMIGAFLLDGVLRGDHHEGGLQRIGLSVYGDLPFLHYLEQGGLRLGRSPVDLIDEHDIAEDRSRLEREDALPRIEHRGADHVARHEVGRELDT